MTKHLFGCVIERAALRSVARKSAQLIAIEENATFSPHGNDRHNTQWDSGGRCYRWFRGRYNLCTF
jgi:hypothetical protein